MVKLYWYNYHVIQLFHNLAEISAKLIETSSKTGHNIGKQPARYNQTLLLSLKPETLFVTIAEDYVKKTKAKVNARGGLWCSVCELHM